MSNPPPSSAYASIPTSAAHPEVRTALELLTVVLADAFAARVSDDLADEVADIVTGLIAVHPPLPPLRYPDHGPEDDEHALVLLRRAAGRLRIAVFCSPDHGEKMRAAIAGRQLHDLIGRWQP